MPAAPPSDPPTLRLPPGNEAVRRRLVSLARSDRLHHCLLFEGPGGVGKADSARWLAMLVNCQGPPELLGPRTAPCGGCWSCRNIARRQHPDVIELAPDPDKATRIISVGQARELLSALVMHNFSATLRFVIIDPAEAMTAEAANALLKTFEEPPADTVFVLVCQRPADLLPTVRSRSQRVRFGPVQPGVVAAWLADHGVDQGDQLAVLAEGCPARALELAEGELSAWHDARDSVVEALQGTAVDRLAWTEKHGRGERAVVMPGVERTLDALGRLLRDVLLRCARPDDQPLFLYNADRLDLVDDWAARLGTGGVVEMSGALAQARADLDANVNTRLALDALLAALAAQLGPPRRHGPQA